MKQSRRPFDEYQLVIGACRACPNVIGNPVTGAVGGARVMLVGQAPGPHEVVDRRPFAYTAGRTLFRWLALLGVDEPAFRARVHMTAVIRCFPGKEPQGGDRLPDVGEIERCGRHLDRELRLLRPRLVIAVGTLAAQQLLGESMLARVVGRVHRVARAGASFDLIVLPHPSGRSTWVNKPENRALLDRSLQLLSTHAAFRETFARNV